MNQCEPHQVRPQNITLHGRWCWSGASEASNRHGALQKQWTLWQCCCKLAMWLHKSQAAWSQRLLEGPHALAQYRVSLHVGASAQADGEDEIAGGLAGHRRHQAEWHGR